MKGGDSGHAAMVPHDAKASPLIRFVSGEDPEIVMPPPKSNVPKLSTAEVQLLRDWINAGPAWPEAMAGAKGRCETALVTCAFGEASGTRNCWPATGCPPRSANKFTEPD